MKLDKDKIIAMREFALSVLSKAEEERIKIAQEEANVIIYSDGDIEPAPSE